MQIVWVMYEKRILLIKKKLLIRVNLKSFIKIIKKIGCHCIIT